MSCHFKGDEMSSKKSVAVYCPDCGGTGRDYLHHDHAICTYCDGEGVLEVPEDYQWAFRNPHPRVDVERQRMRDSEERDDMNRDIWGIS